LRAAEDATVIDTSPLSVAQVVERVLTLARSN
jgi:cytidylate kinase